jgi:hypothetical protein
MHHASTCPADLDEDLIAAALRAYPTVGTPQSSLPSYSLSTTPCSSYGTALSRSPSSGSSGALGALGGAAAGPGLWAAHSFFRGAAQQTHASITRQLFDAQADAATARAQVTCLQEALLQVGWLPRGCVTQV